MPTEKTEILYDQSQAEKELKKLDRNVKRSSATVKREFKKADQDIRKLRQSLKKAGNEGKGLGNLAGGFKRIGDAVGPLSPQISGVVSKIGTLAGSGGLIATGFAAATAAIGVTIANVVGLADKLADIDARIQVINKVAERTLKFRNLASAVGDADENRRLTESRRALALQQAQTKLRQNEVERARDAAKELVSIRKAAFSRIDQAHKASIRARQTAEERLADKLKELAGDQNPFANQPKGRQVGSLTALAAQKAREGNVEEAEALIAKAKELSTELGDHVFFTNQIEKAQKAVVRALEKDVREAKSKESGLARQKKEIQENVTEAEGFAKVLDDQLKKILRQNRALAAQRTIIKESAQLTKDVQTQEEGQRTVQSGVNTVRDISGSIGGQSVVGEFRDLLANALKAAKSPASLVSGQDASRALDLIGGEFAKKIDEIFADRQITPREGQQLGEFVAKFNNAVGELEKGLADGSITPSKEQDVSRFISLFDALEKIVRGSAQTRSGGLGFDEGITPGNVAENRKELERVVEKREIQQEINVNIEGGMIDQSTIEQITEIIRREVRKETQRQSGS